MISLETNEVLYNVSGFIWTCCFIVGFVFLQAFFEDIPPDKSQLFEVNGVIERDSHGKYNGIKVTDFETHKTYGCKSGYRDEDIGNTGKLLIYKHTICQIEVNGKMRMSYEDKVATNKFKASISIYSFVIGIVFLVLFWKVA